MLDLLLIILVEEPPKPSEVKAGPLGFAVWMFMILAVIVLGFSLTKRLRKAEASKKAGLYGDPPAVEESEAPQDGSGDSGHV